MEFASSLLRAASARISALTLASLRRFSWTPRTDEAFIAMPSKKMMPADSIIEFNGQR
jgi:hypothetical protein